jgi:hypothetical protein
VLTLTRLAQGQERLPPGVRRRRLATRERGRTGQIGSLLVGVQGPGGLQYTGHVGTGFTHQMLLLLGSRLDSLRQPASPFAKELPREHAREAVWVRPLLVIDVAFAAWTALADESAQRLGGGPDGPDQAAIGSRCAPSLGIVRPGQNLSRAPTASAPPIYDS